MILVRALAVVATAALVMSPVAAAPKKQSAVDWTRTVSLTPEGGFRMGNPNAKVKLVEYGSLTCPACRRFAETAMTPLKVHVRTGKVSFEYRNYILNGVDVSAAIVARCGGPQRFFPIVDRLYATQREWLARISTLSDSEKQRLSSLPNNERVAGIAQSAGILPIAAVGGLPAAQAKKCLANPAALDRLSAMVEAGRALGVQGTPTFFVNGTMVSAGDWASLEPHLNKAGG